MIQQLGELAAITNGQDSVSNTDSGQLIAVCDSRSRSVALFIL